MTGEPTPAAAGTSQNMTVSGLTASTTYYFAMKTSDEVPNTSALSNVASGHDYRRRWRRNRHDRRGAQRHRPLRRGHQRRRAVRRRRADQHYSGLRVEDSGGNPVPAQFQVLNRWWAPNYDDSIKWLQVIFPASVAANGTQHLLPDDRHNPAPADPVSVSVNGSTYTVNTGTIKAVINGAAFKLFDEV